MRTDYKAGGRNCGRIAACGLAALFCAAQGSAAFAIGDKSAAYLKMDMGARAVGMGGAYVAAEPDINTPWYNPAGPVLMTEGQMGFMYNRWISETSLSYAGYVQPSENGRSAFGAGVLYYNMGSIEKVTNTGYTTGGTYSAYSAVGLATYAKRFGSKLALGMNFKYISEHIDSISASAMAVDLGMMYPGERWSWGFAVQNVGQGMAFGEGGQSAPLPMTIRAGARFKASEKFGITSELESADNFVIKAGFEYVSGNPAGTQFVGRFGYKTLKPSEFSGMTGMTLGLGVRRTAWTFDIGIVPYGSYGMTQWLTFTRRIGFAKASQRCRRTASESAGVPGSVRQPAESYAPSYLGGAEPAAASRPGLRNLNAGGDASAADSAEETADVNDSAGNRDPLIRGSRF
ncbi:MAG: PorV/PorQ family protein [Elusimicrobiaceae bacterium]|nr:PorV/PorQ family protein [Elusimicrobiaceae bacterium]